MSTVSSCLWGRPGGFVAALRLGPPCSKGTADRRVRALAEQQNFLAALHPYHPRLRSTRPRQTVIQIATTAARSQRGMPAAASAAWSMSPSAPSATHHVISRGIRPHLLSTGGAANMAIQGSTKRADGVYSTCRIEVIAVLAPRTVGPPDARRTRRAFWCLGYYPSSIGSLPWLHKTPLRALYRGGAPALDVRFVDWGFGRRHGRRLAASPYLYTQLPASHAAMPHPRNGGRRRRSARTAGPGTATLTSSVTTNCCRHLDSY